MASLKIHGTVPVVIDRLTMLMMTGARMSICGSTLRSTIEYCTHET